MKTSAIFNKDVAERAARTFFQGFAVVIAGAPVATDFSAVKSILSAAVAGGGGALLSVLMSWVAKKRGIVNSASLNSSV